MTDTPTSAPQRRRHPPRGTATAWAIAAAVLAVVLAWALRDVLLLLFGAILFAVVLNGLAIRVRRVTRLPHGVSLALVFVVLVAALVGAGWSAGPRIGEQAAVLRRDLPPAIAAVRARAESIPALRTALQSVPDERAVLGDGQQTLARARQALSSTVGALTATVLWLFVSVVLAATPAVYVDGLVRLVPPRHDAEARELLAKLGRTLGWWALGRVSTMTFVGLGIGTGLTLLGVPLAFVLGLIAALLSFVPNLGPVLGAVPGIVLALAQSPTTAAWVAGVYLVVQLCEAFVLSPIIDRRTVYLPPALTVAVQLALGALTGLAGVALAAPLTAAATVLVRRLWVEGRLGRVSVATR
jgi:predicted PurR-regulated permease PerM